MSRDNLARMENQKAPWLGFDAYSISRERYLELRNGCAAGKYSHETLSRACQGLGFIEPWILLSVQEGKSFDRMQISWDLGETERPAVSRSSFYRFRRRFFANLDRELKERGVECETL